MAHSHHLTRIKTPLQRKKEKGRLVSKHDSSALLSLMSFITDFAEEGKTIIYLRIYPVCLLSCLPSEKKKKERKKDHYAYS
jgi:hypothetical protein